jgi:putative aldouronate transport system substrate-binding protein
VREQYSAPETAPPEIDWTTQLHSSRALNAASMNYSNEYANIILKAGDIEANWRAWVREKMVIVQPVLDELNAKR